MKINSTQHTSRILRHLSSGALALGLTATALAQGITAFTYQGRLTDGVNPATGIYDLSFTLYDAASGPGAVGSPVPKLGTGITNGLFTVTLDFGAGVFAGPPRWLEIAAKTNGASTYVTLTPRQALTPTPYALFAPSAGSVPAAGLTGTLANDHLVNSALAVRAGTGLSGGGTVALGGSTTLSNAGVLSVTGNADITASPTNGNVVLGTTATSASTPTTLVKRDAGGSFAATNLTLQGGLYLPTTTNTAGVIYAGGNRFLHAYGMQNTFVGTTAGNLALDGWRNTGVGYAALIANTDGSANTATGGRALYRNTSGSNNIALGYAAGYNLTTGSDNIAIGHQGVAGESRTIRIGTQGDQTNTFLAGIYGNTAVSGVPVGVNAAGQLGTLASSGNEPPPGVTPILNMIWIQPGTFIMGSPDTEAGHLTDENQRTVTLTKGFWMGHHEVTQGEYQSLTSGNPSAFTGDLSRPVETVSWIDATNFCRMLTQRELAAGRLPAGWAYRLPTEAEWEYCCRSLTTTRFYYGDDLSYNSLTNYAWYNANSGSTTHPVGQKLANVWGLVDMIGNVSEWCWDWYGATYSGMSVTDPLGPSSGSYRVLRGGFWSVYADDCRSAQRGGNDPSYRGIRIGFRVVLAPGQP